MGTWGINTFEDDTACDWIYSLQEADGLDFLQASLNREEEGGYLELEACVSILCASEIIHGILVEPREGVPEDAINWIDENKELDVAGLRELCVEKIDRVLAGKSELNELWEGNEEEYPEWKAKVTDLPKKQQ